MKGTAKMNWWKVIAIILIILCTCTLLLKGCVKALSRRQSVPETYTTTVNTGGILEATYLSMGEHEVDYLESYAMMSFEKYEIFYPADIKQMNTPLPVVVFVNGTGIGGSKYHSLQKHMASWGFITIATEEQHAWNGFSAEMCVRFLERLNGLELFDDKNNVLYNKIDTNNIGITGHSQGGYGVVNAITKHEHATNYKAAVLLSSDASFSGNDFMWETEPTLIKTPTLIISSTGPFDSIIASAENVQGLYSTIPDSVDKVLAVRNDADHGEMLYSADGYVTAWFMYYLKGDLSAADAFFGDSAELFSNPLYQNQLSYKVD